MKLIQLKNSIRLLITGLILVMLSACTSVKPSAARDQQHTYNAVKSPIDYLIVDENVPPIIKPRTSTLVELVNEDLFSISLRDIPVKEFLHALALDAELDLLMGEGLSGQLSLHMQNKAIAEILDAVARQLPLRYELSNTVLQVFLDKPYLETYRVDYLNVHRTAASDIDLSTQIGSISLSTEAGGGGAGNNSRAKVVNLSVNDFWATLENNLIMMVAESSQLNAEAVIVNRETGFVSVRAKHALQKKIAAYIDVVVASAQRQVLIEALVIELVLNDKFQAGVDWRVLTKAGASGNYVQNFSASPVVTASNISGISAPNAVFSIFKNSASGGSISGTLNLLREFGEVKILSSPKINALNNQSAVLKVVDNRVYFALDVKRVTEDDVETLTTTSTIKTVPIGLVMNVLPFISKNKDIILNIRPTISRILGFAADPNPILAVAGVQNLVPEIQVREMESVLRVASGGLVVIGGLMQDQVVEQEVSVPGLSLLPGLGRLFRYTTKIKSKTELLVLLRPSVIESQVSYNDGLKAYLP